MDLSRLIEETRAAAFRILDPAELELLRAEAPQDRKVEATLNHVIEVFAMGDLRLLLERSDKDEPLLRVMESDFAADAFVKDRVDTYDRMWDGCGCKVNYYE